MENTIMMFKDLAVGQTFDFVNDEQPMMNSFYYRCIKTSARKYQTITEPILKCRVGSTSAHVYHVS